MVLWQDLSADVREEDLLLSILWQEDSQLFNALGQLVEPLKLYNFLKMFVDHLVLHW